MPSEADRCSDWCGRLNKQLLVVKSRSLHGATTLEKNSRQDPRVRNRSLAVLLSSFNGGAQGGQHRYHLGSNGGPKLEFWLPSDGFQVVFGLAILFSYQNVLEENGFKLIY